MKRRQIVEKLGKEMITYLNNAVVLTIEYTRYKGINQASNWFMINH